MSKEPSEYNRPYIDHLAKLHAEGLLRPAIRSQRLGRTQVYMGE